MITDSLGLVALAMGAGAGSNPTLTRTGNIYPIRIRTKSARSSREASLKMKLSHARTVKHVNQLTKGDAR